MRKVSQLAAISDGLCRVRQVFLRRLLHFARVLKVDLSGHRVSTSVHLEIEHVDDVGVEETVLLPQQRMADRE